MNTTLHQQHTNYIFLQIKNIAQDLILSAFALCSLALFFCVSSLYAQQAPAVIVSPAIDSLHLALRTARDTARVRTLNALCWEYRNKDALRSFDYSNQAYKLAKELGFAQGLAENRNFTGIVYRNIGD